MLALMGLLWGCSPKVYTPPSLPVQIGQAEASGDKWGVLEQASGLLDVSVRQRASFLLIRYWPEEAGGKWSHRGLFDPSPYVQRRSVEALSERRHEAASIALLNQVVEREQLDPYTRGKAALALSEEGNKEGLPALKRALSLPAHHSSLAPLALAAAAMGDEAAAAQLLSFLEKGDFPLEVDFFLDCGSVKLEGLAGALETGIPLLEEELHLPIAHSLVRLGSKSGTGIFEDALSSENVELQHEALDFLESLDVPQSESLLKKARRSASPSASTHAELLMTSRAPHFPGAAIDALQSEDRELRQLAFQSLVSWLMRNPGQKKALVPLREAAINALSDLEPSVQEEALLLLGAVGRKREYAHIEPFLRSENPRLRVEAAGAILQIEARATSEP